MNARALRAFCLVVPLLALGAAPANAQSGGYHPEDEPPFGGRDVPELTTPLSTSRPPPGFRLSAREATAIAARAPGVAEGVARAQTRGPGIWQVSFGDPSSSPGDDLPEQARVFVDDEAGTVIEAWTGTQVDVELARGYEDAVGWKVPALWFFGPLCLLFIAPFVDFRNPVRLLHLDLLVMLGFGLSLAFFEDGNIKASVPLVYPVLGYLFLRLAIAGFRPRELPGRLIPHLSARLLIAGIIALIGLHGFTALESKKVIDVGLAGVIGADRLTDGADVYGEGTAQGIRIRGDVYGPANYLAYVPFEQAFPWSGEWDSLPAARAAALCFDLLTALLLVMLGRRLREGEEGRTLGIALAFAWLAYPFTLYSLASGFNDAIVAASVTGALVVLARPEPIDGRPGGALGRGAITAIASLTKFAPIVLAPLLAAGRGDRERSVKGVALFAVGLLVAAAVLTLPLLPDGGFRELYDRTFGYQASRGSPFSIWGLETSLDTVHTLSKLFAVAFGAALFFYPRRRTAVQACALGAACLIAIQVAANHWLYPYTLWFAPLALAALFASMRGPEPEISSVGPQGRQV